MYPVRVNIGIMCFMGCFIAYMLRVNISITILAMVVPRVTSGNATDGNSTILSVPDVRDEQKYLQKFFFEIKFPPY